MPQLFLFCIGGTGVRVLKSLIFLLASGVEIKARKIIPIIIDPDSSNGDVQRTLEILNNYQKIRNHLEFDKNSFFKTTVQTLGSLEVSSEGENFKISDSYKWDIDGTRDGLFNKFIGYDNLDETNKALISLLYSEDNLSSELSVGFKGNPHIGSVVLNQFRESKEFKYFASSFREGDRIFVVSSIFGGTGAAGFPLLVKNIREVDQSISNHDRLRNAPIGAITVTPYFGVAPEDNIKIDKNTFISKTKAALAYYENNLSHESKSLMNSLYYIGDRVNKDYEAAEGEIDQKNDAHVVEVICASAIVDFLEIDASRLKSDKGRATEPLYKEFGLLGDDRELNFKNFGRKSHRFICRPLANYALAVNYWKNNLESALRRPANWARSKKAPIDLSFLDGHFYDTLLRTFNGRFEEWLTELARNERAFAPFEFSTSQLQNFVKGYTQTKRNIWGKEIPDKWDYSDYDATIDRIEKSMTELSSEKKFIALFSKATTELIKKRVPNLQ